VRAEIEGAAEEAASLGRILAERVLGDGGDAILEELRRHAAAEDRP
jgi:hypothetical protein